MTNERHDKFKATLSKLEVHDHLCLIYETEAEQFSAIIPFIKLGLQRGEKCLFITDDDTSASFLKAIEDTSLDTEEPLKKGSLEILTERETFLPKGSFDPDEMLSFLKDNMTRARFEGFAALRLIEDMSWALEEDPGSERLIEYETRLNYFIKQHDCLALCQYNKHIFPPSLLLEVLRVQPLVIFRNMVLENYLHVPPDEFIRGPAAVLNRQLENITLLNDGWKEGPATENKFRRSVDSLLDNFGIFSAVRDKTGKIVDFKIDYVNKAACQANRMTFDKQVDKRLYDILPARADTGLLEAFVRVVESGHPFTRQGAIFEDIHEGQAQKRFLNIRASKLDDNVVATWQDITEEKEGVDRAALFSQTIEAAPDSFQIVNLEGKLIYCNRKTQTLFGYSAQEMEGMPFDSLLAEPTFGSKVLIPTILKTGHWAEEIEVKRKDGSLLDLWLAMSLARDKAGHPVAIVCESRDISKRKKNEDRLELFSQAIAQAPDSIHITDLEGRIIYSNKSAEKMFGYSAQELEEMHVGQLHIDQDQPRKEIIPSIHQTGSWSGDVKMKHKDGHIFPTWLTTNVAKDKAGNPIAMIVENRDMTEIKKTQEALKESELWSRNIINTAHEGIWVLDKEANTSFVNPQTAKLLGYFKEEMEGQPLFNFMDEEAAVEAKEYFKQSKEGIVEKHDFRFKHKNGTDVWTIVSTTPMFNNTGEFTGALGMITDITDLKLEEKSLSAGEHRYRLLFEASLVSIWEEDWSEVKTFLDDLQAQGISDLRAHFAEHPQDALRCVQSIRVTDVNQATLDLYGAKTKDELGKNLGTLFPPESLKTFMEGFFAAIEGQFVWQAENITNSLSGDALNINAQTVIPEEHEKTWKRVIINIIDLTALKNATLEIRQLNETLEQRVQERTIELEVAYQELESFSYSISHDLQAPLRAIDGFSQILWDDYSKSLDDEGKRLLDIVHSETVRMKQLIDDLLTFSRSSRAKINPVQVNMTELANEVSYQLTQLEPERNIKVKVKTLPDTYGDMILFKQVFANLISNAIKFTAPRERAIIEIGSWTEGDENIYFVEDNGLGFDMRYVDKLFGIFERLETGDEFAGTGVGLAIVKRIIDRHGGRVWAKGQPKKGSTFYFSLPKAEATTQSEAA